MLEKEYKIAVDTEDWVTPEETLLDSGSNFSDLEQPISHISLRMVFSLMIGLLVVVFFSITNISVLGHQQYADLALQNKSVQFSVPPPRGIIFDSSGKPLVRNLPQFSLLAISREIKNSGDADIDKVAAITGKPAEEFRSLISGSILGSSIFFAALDLSKDQVLALTQLNPKGFYVLADTKREYIDGPIFSHIIGYTGKVNREDLKDIYYQPTDTVGRLGLEAQFEEILRGEHGRILFDKELSNKSTVLNSETLSGDNLILNIDSDLQKKTFSVIDGILRESGLSRAAAVIQNPNTGEVKALVSFPYYNNNIFNDTISISEYRNIFENRLRPLFNRVISGLYNPGSTIKPLVGLIGLQEEIITPRDTIQDCVSISFPNPTNPGDPYIFRNWRPELGSFNLRRAIANSCNIYFFTIGGGFGDVIGLGIERLAQYLSKSFANKKLGVDLPGEEVGFVPTAEWKKKTTGESWYTGDTFNVSIGQGDLLVTPLWLNTYVSAIANGGTIYKPRIAARIVDSVKSTKTLYESEPLGKLPFDQKYIDEMKSDMHETVLSGTAQILKDIPISIAAKTGTAEVVKGSTINALFISFAPVERPEISMTILFEGASSNQGLAVRAANQIYRWYFLER